MNGGEREPGALGGAWARLGEPGALTRVLPAVLYVAAVFVAGTARGGDPGLQVPHLDKLFHLLAFLGMQVAVSRAAAFLWPRAGRGARLGGTLLFSLSAGAVLELVQALLPYRSAEWLDLVADGLGALAGAALLARWEGAEEDA